MIDSDVYIKFMDLISEFKIEQLKELAEFLNRYIANQDK